MSYQLDSVRTAMQARLPGSTLGRVPRVVYWIGLTSLLTDISAEMIASTLPVFLFSVLSLSPLQVGFIDGIYHGVTAVVRIAAGYWADAKVGNHFMALLGYALSTLARLTILLGAPFGALLAFAGLLLDRIGKGIRTAPRDSLIAASVHPEMQGAAFGVHRSMDAVGAFAGPLIAAILLWWLPMGYHWILVVSFAFSLTGVVVFSLKVPRNPALTSAVIGVISDDVPRAPSTSHKPSVLRDSLREITANAAFMRVVALAALMSIFTISDGLIFASLQQAGAIDEPMVPFMFVGTALVFVLAAAPVGRLADRFGFARTILGGYGLLSVSYFVYSIGSLFGFKFPLATLATTALLLGLHYAATDGMLVVLAIRQLDARVRTTGLAMLTSVIALSRVVASTGFGFVWQQYSQVAAALLFSCGLFVCLLLGCFVFKRGLFDSDAAMRPAQ